jgi:outer membrane scaffolding protein for murein synthesis (MipA/OmpV family)
VDTRINAKWLELSIGRIVLFLALIISPLPVLAAGVIHYEIKPFGLLDVNGAFAARYFYDEQDRSSDTTPSSFEERITWEEELFINTKSYVYHPGLLNIDFGFGPKLVQQQFASVSGSNRNNESFLNLNLRLNFLELKSYPFSLYYRKDNPSVTTGLAGRYVTEREEYGLDAQLYQSGRTRVGMDMGHFETVGGGFDRVIDEQVDRGGLRASTAYGVDNTIELSQRYERRGSASGSIGLPIQESTTRLNFTELRTRNYFGSGRRHLVTQNYRRRDNQNYRIATSLSHNDRLKSRFDYSFDSVDRDNTDSSTHNVKASVNNRFNPRTNLGFNAFYQGQEQPGFDQDSLGVGTNFSYERPIKSGSVGVGFRASQVRTDQQSDTDFVQVFDEALVLAGTTPVALTQEFVVADSVVVRNVSNTQTFVEDFDYRLVVVGSVTSIQRLLGGNIADGQTVLVDYEYETSGTAEFDTSYSSVSLNANFLRYFSTSAQVQVKQTDLRSGELTTPTNDLESLRLGISADFPVGQRWKFGVSASYTDMNEEIAPSVSSTLIVDATAVLWRSARLLVSASHLMVDQEKSIEDVDQVQYRVGLSSMFWSRLLVTYDVSYLEDDGGSLPRQQTQHRLDMQWNYRAVRFLLRARRADERLGATERDDTQVTAEVARFFR